MSDTELTVEASREKWGAAAMVVDLTPLKPVSDRQPNNPSGIRPTEYKVLIDPTPVESKIGSIYIPDEALEKEQFAQIKGRIVAVSPHAFSYEDKHAWAEAGIVKPKPGDVAIYAKYLGIRVKGKDGKEYLLVNDKDICATIEE